MSIISSALKAAGTVIKATVRFVARTVVAGVKAIPGTLKAVGRGAVGAVRLAGRAAVASIKVAGRAAYVGAGFAVSAADNILGLLGRGGGRELPEPEAEVFEPGTEFSEHMEEMHLAHELEEVEGRFADDPNAEVYRYLVSDDKYRRTTKLDGVKPEVEGWACRLPAAERLLVKRAGCEALIRHLSGGKQIKGVPAVKRREAVIDFTQRSRDSAFEMNDDFEQGRVMRMAMQVG